MKLLNRQTGEDYLLRQWKPVFVVVALAVATFTGLHILLPPSFLLPVAALVVASAAGLILHHAGWWPWRTMLASMVILAALSLGVEATWTHPASAGPVTQDPTFLELDALLRERGFSGAVLVARNGQILFDKGYGYADRKMGIANTPQTQFAIGSLTKQFTAMAILMLQADGKLGVQDRVCQYIDQCPAAWREVTIHHLLANSSGIPDFFVPCFWSTDAFDNAIAKASQQPLLFQPGERWAYTNVGYFLLGRIIENVAGRPYGTFLQERIFGPLGMQNTGMGDIGPDTVGYLNGFLPTCRLDVGAYYSEGGLYSTVEDLYRWDQALYTERLIPKRLLASMFSAHVTTTLQFQSIPLSYGYGWAVASHSERQMAMHGGFLPGFTSMIARYPDDRLTIVVLSNQQRYGGGSISEALVQRIVP